MNKVFITILLLISLLINIGLVYLFVIKGETVETEDSRIAIKMSEDNRDFVLLEMRDFLESVQQINEGLLENDSMKIIKAAEKSGGSVIDHAPKGLLKSLPSNFKKLGFSTHDIFDDIAKSTKENFDKKSVNIQLNTLLNKCVACHQSYKISQVLK